MSQQMHSDEELRGYAGSREYETSYTPALGEPGGSYEQLYTLMPAQKIATNFRTGEKNSPSAGQRLALAIVSLVVLLGALFAISDGSYSFMMIAARLVGVVVICLAIVAINFIYGFRR